MATGREELRNVLYQIISRMVEDGELVPVYERGELVDIIVNMPAGRQKDT